jgi:hypothetical protein
MKHRRETEATVKPSIGLLVLVLIATPVFAQQDDINQTSHRKWALKGLAIGLAAGGASALIFAANEEYCEDPDPEERSRCYGPALAMVVGGAAAGWLVGLLVDATAKDDSSPNTSSTGWKPLTVPAPIMKLRQPKPEQSLCGTCSSHLEPLFGLRRAVLDVEHPLRGSVSQDPSSSGKDW